MIHNPTAPHVFGVPALLLSDTPAPKQALPSGVVDTTAACQHCRVRVDPHLCGHVTPRTLAALRVAGCRVIQVGAAAYVTRGTDRWIVGVWDGARPPFADRLDQHHRWLIGRGAPTPVEARREAAWKMAFRALDDPGLPWWITAARVAA